MAKKNKFKRNKSDIPLNIFDGGGIITDMYTLNISGPKLSQSGLPSSYLTGLKYGNMGNTSNIDPNFMSGLGEAALGAGIGFLGNAGGNLIAGGKSSGIGNTVGSLGNTIGSALMTVNPLVGGLTMGATSLLGGAFNATFGSKLNEERIALAENEINAAKSFNADASDFNALALLIANSPIIAGFNLKDIGSDGLFSNKAKNKYKSLLALKEFAENWVDRSIANNATNLQLNQMNNLLTNYAAYGGLLDNNFGGRKKAFGGDLLTNGTVFSNNVIEVNNGSTHEENPMEGVLMGVDSNGIPNLVEEGELIWNDYVFSNRIPVPNAVRNKYKLRGTKDMTFSDAAKKILKASEERPNDPIANDTLNINLTRLANEQEIMRELKKNKRLGKLYAIGGELLRYAPVVGSAIGLGLTLLSKPNYSRADALALFAQNAGKVTPISYDPLGNYLTYKPTDMNYIANRMAALAGATRRNIMNTSGGNRANAVGSLLAADYNSQIALADAIRQGEDTNWNRLMQTETFNRGTNLYNSKAALEAAMANQEARMKASQLGLSGYTTAMKMKDDIDALRNASISANFTNLFDSLGDIGREEVIKKMVKDNPALLYDYYGKYKGSNKSAKGGKLNRKKRGGFTY